MLPKFEKKKNVQLNVLQKMELFSKLENESAVAICIVPLPYIQQWMFSSNRLPSHSLNPLNQGLSVSNVTGIYNEILNS